VAPRSTPSSNPARYLTALVVLLIVLLVSVLGGNIFKPADWHKSFKVGLGLDLSSGTSITLKAVPPHGGTPNQGEMAKAVQIMTDRVEATGLTGSSVVPQGNNEIVVSVPGAGAQKVATLVGETALLRLRQVLLMAPNTTTAATTPTPSPSKSSSASTKASSSPSSSASASASSSASASPSTGSGQAISASQIAASSTPSPSVSASSSSPASSASPSASPSSSTPANSKPTLTTTTSPDAQGAPGELNATTVKLFDKLNCSAKEGWKQQIYNSVPNNWDNPKAQTVTCFKEPGTNVWVKYAMSAAIVQGSDLSSVQAVDQTTGWVVTFNVKSPASSVLGKYTTTMSSKYYSNGAATSPLDYLAIVLDGELQGAPPEVTSPISTSGQINGGTGNGFTQAQAETLADVLKYGSLPLTFKNLYTSSVSASLGADQLSAGLFAALVGLALVVVYSFLYYRGLGVVSVLSLAIAASISYLSVILLSKYESFTLSLAGVAGLIVAIGITADSFIVYFERLRDEVREGRSLRTAVERGWGRARRTILVSDTVSFLAALLLYILSQGDVRGFAFTLGLTTLVDVVVVFLFTKPMITLLARTKFYGQGHPLSGLDPGRLGARAPWRGGRRPAASPGAAATSARTPTSTREA
jgi:preprotein translocase subunit SecD